MLQPETSIVIRARNEAKWIGECLKRLREQTYNDFEIIVVDSGSTDQTLEIVKSYDVKIVEIPSKSFSYPYALNVGIAHAQCTKYIVVMSAHSLPTSPYWLKSGTDKFLLSDKVMGVYGPNKALPDGSFWDKLFYSFGYMRRALLSFPRNYRIIEDNRMGVLGFTNAIVKKDLWDIHHMDETYAGGGDDCEWSHYWFSRGYIAIEDLDFAVLHSHSLNLSQWLKQLQHWKDNTQPHAFKYLSYRSDPAHADDTTND